MGMSDQYDDGRYDGDMNPGYIEMPGGWCIPAEQAPEPFTFPRIQRGGIKYPKPPSVLDGVSEEARRFIVHNWNIPGRNTMPERLTKAQIAHELKLNTELINTLHRSRAFLQKQMATALPAEPPSNCTMFTVSVRFKMRGTRYQFLILRSGKKYFTTGTKAEHAKFDSWQALCEWLEGPDVYDHSDIEVLKGAGQQVSFDTGTLVAEGTIGEPPF
jgi:hypothetical protein